ncbi:dyslexia-associated protein KIAA0319-like protein isoform X4 [Sebastes umbrosus]|uniref:dyslexia-associated protein KIAA0319-like protein isoform X4 n=1 Tax=Sebastes umbrosus TaxID=72105 RepID=UPI00189DA45E|nr:dyslexia-associated protein KIAA0319-like protein isoform X4 [Sebastes umbrosus]
MSYAHHKLLTWSLPHLLFLPLTYLLLLASPTGVSANLCRVTGGVLGIDWSGAIGLGWHSLARGIGGATCWQSCCLNPSCNAVWSLGGQCVLLRCSQKGGCPITSLPQPHKESLGLLQLLSKSPIITARRRRAPHAKHAEGQAPHTGHLTSTEIPELEKETPTVPSTAAFVQTAQKNLSQLANGSADIAPAPPQQNSTDTVDTAASSNSSDVSTSATTATAVITTPTQTGKEATVCSVRELVVSAGESVEVTLPLNEVELNAFVVPTPPGTNYAFDWRLITHPKDYSGEMAGKHSKTLQLSQLTVGLYEFEVTVDGEGAHGEGYVNVTVKPEPRVNKRPVAVVSPKFQEISLPTSSTVIDGSQSTDDDKVVVWHWEEVKGPLREEKVSADTPVLTLNGLVPGNYTFSLTVTDSDGATNSTQATLLVNKARDYRPVANAGANQVIQLPRNSMTLYGNQSTDDHDSLSYEWSLSPESKDKVVEMQGVRTPILQLSAMQEGDYTFQLTVTDSAGQQETAQVTVIVQPENNKPPVADAGPEKELTLPVDRTTLDGSKSKDDQKIATYHWKLTKGPDGVKIENADTAVATVTGLEVGTYMFSLTVTDDRKLSTLLRRSPPSVCQLNCSSHGDCDSFTRRCVCHPFWMENFITAQLGDAESNCEWSVLYVTIASFMIVVAIATVVWGIVCCCNRRKSKVRRSKSRYKMLEADEQDSLELQPPRAARMKPVPAPTSSALMHSDSDLDSDEGQGGVPWTEQERGHLLRPQNGSLRNGQGPVRGKKQREELL